MASRTWWDMRESWDSQNGGGLRSNSHNHGKAESPVEPSEGLSWKVLAISKELIQLLGRDAGLCEWKCHSKWWCCRYILRGSLQNQHGWRWKSAKNESGIETSCKGSWKSTKCVQINLHRSVEARGYLAVRVPQCTTGDIQSYPPWQPCSCCLNRLCLGYDPWSCHAGEERCCSSWNIFCFWSAWWGNTCSMMAWRHLVWLDVVSNDSSLALSSKTQRASSSSKEHVMLKCMGPSSARPFPVITMLG